MQDLQLYSEKIIIEPGYTDQSKVALIGIDLTELAGQIYIDSMLDQYDFADIANYIERRRKEDEE